MAERHTFTGRQEYETVTADPTTRSAMARASDGLPFKPYVYRGADRDEPPAVTAARRRHRTLNEQIEQIEQRMLALDAEAMPDTGPGYEWYRELADD